MRENVKLSSGVLFPQSISWGERFGSVAPSFNFLFLCWVSGLGKMFCYVSVFILDKNILLGREFVYA